MNVKNVFIEAMQSPFDLTQMLHRINTHHILGNLTDADRSELEALARQKADPFGGLNVTEKLLELEERIRKIEQQKAEDNGDDASADPYVEGKWYNNGDHIAYNGKVYVCCNVPDGHVCTWPPDVYPAYWQEVS